MKCLYAQAIKKIAIKFFTTIILFLCINYYVKAQCNASSPSWCILGNSATTSSNYIGTIDAQPLIFKTTEIEWMRISPSGNVGIFTITPAYKLDVVGDINFTGALRIAAAPGNAGQVLTSAGGGTNTWSTPTTGTVTSVIGTAPIISSGGNAPAISIAQANASTNGFLSSTDWTTFNNKVASITAGPGLAGGTITSTGTISLSIPVVIANGGTNSTTIGSAGSVIYSNGTQLVSTAVGISGQVLISSGTGAPTWITQTTGTITSVTGTAPIISSGGATPAISITQAGTSASGFLSSTDWNTFNNKLTGSGTLNYLPKWTPNGSALGNSSIFDNGNVGIGTTTPQAKLHVKNGSVLFDGTTGNTLATGAGTRMMWIPEKAAFRAGAINATQWNNANIGLYSGAFGYSTTAESYACFVVGRFNKNSASYSKTTWVSTDPVFVVGIGQDSQKSGNAITVLKNGNVGIGTPTPINRLDVVSGIAIGANYAGSVLAPLNGAIIRGKVGIGTTTPKNQLDVEGGIAIGATYSGSKIAPANGAIIEGNVGIGTDLTSNTYNSSYKLAVNGTIRAKRVIIETLWSDFVFEKNYKLTPLAEVEQYIKQHGHLSEIPSAKEIETNGGDLGNLVKLQMQKIEELTLYIIELKKEIDLINNK
jgi:hypothetical protein